MWSARGARVTRSPPIFLEHGRARPVPIRSAAAGSPPCLTVALLAPRTSELLVDIDEPKPNADPLQQLINRTLPPGHPPVGEAAEDRRLKSVSGALVIARCGSGRDELKRLVVDVSGARSALEVIVAEATDDLGDLKAILPERASGPVAPRGDPGRPLEPGPLPERLTRADKRARLDGAESVTRIGMRASAAGTGEFSLRLAEGCHRVEVMAEVPPIVPRRATDIDAEARESESERSLARDRADAPDARLDFCLGEATVVDVPYIGAAGPVNVMVSDARWALPLAVPSRWGPRARGGFASALRRRRAPSPQSEPIFEALGVQGETSAPIEVDPGKCYLAAVAVMRGEPRGVRLAVELGSRVLRDEVVERPESALVAFCADLDRSAVLRVEARGSSPWWALVVWPM